MAVLTEAAARSLAARGELGRWAYNDKIIMSMIAFFPWLCLNEQLQAGEFELIPYTRGQAPGGAGMELQRILDSVTSPYRAGGERSINKATVVRINQGDLIRDLDDEERGALFVLSEALSVAALSRREFFKVASLGYQNRDNFRLIIQAFAEAGYDHVYVHQVGPDQEGFFRFYQQEVLPKCW